VLEGKEKIESATYPDEQYLYFLCAKEFGWTPLQTDEQPAYLIDWLLAINNMIGGINANNK
jgi:hypothetical protein